MTANAFSGLWNLVGQLGSQQLCQAWPIPALEASAKADTSTWAIPIGMTVCRTQVATDFDARGGGIGNPWNIVWHGHIGRLTAFGITSHARSTRIHATRF
jgi:hypothetical protein